MIYTNKKLSSIHHSYFEKKLQRCDLKLIAETKDLNIYLFLN